MLSVSNKRSLARLFSRSGLACVLYYHGASLHALRACARVVSCVLIATTQYDVTTRHSLGRLSCISWGRTLVSRVSTSTTQNDEQVPWSWPWPSIVCQVPAWERPLSHLVGRVDVQDLQLGAGGRGSLLDHNAVRACSNIQSVRPSVRPSMTHPTQTTSNAKTMRTISNKINVRPWHPMQTTTSNANDAYIIKSNQRP